MTAGSVAVPTIIPLRHPMPGLHKAAIDSNTKIELRTDTRDARIYYTINGTKPDPFQRFGERCTMLYRGPFTLPAGKQSVKAMAMAGEGERQSAVVTKTFEVEYSPPPQVAPMDDDMEFQQDLERERTKVQLERATEDLLRSTRSAWTDLDDAEQMQQDLARTRYSRRKSPDRYTDSLHQRRDPRHAHLPYSNGTATHMGPPVDHYGWPQEYTTDAIQAMQNMSVNNNQDFLNFTTVTPGQYTSTNQWMPTSYPAQTIRAPPSAYRPQHEADIDIPLSLLNSAPPPSSSKRAETTSVASQTVGLFYPSQRKIDLLEKELEEKAAYEKQMQDRKPLLTEMSPGKGYWRKQIDHICQHLKAHAQNNAEFRALIGEPKMGRMIASSVQEDRQEISFTLSFALRGSKDLFGGRKLGGPVHNGYHGRHAERGRFNRRSDEETLSEDSFITRSSLSSRVRKRTTRRAKPKKKTAPRVSSLDARLLRQLASGDDGSGTEVQQLIDEGADPNCESKSGLPALHVAAKNRHIDCIPVLVQAGADVDAKGPSSVKGNTALHEAVTLGSAGMKSVDALLSCGANQNVKNERGETAYEMATKSGYENLVKRFAAALGQSQLQKMIRPRSSVQ